MTNEELLSGFLDRTLSEDHLLELEARTAASPEFAREVNEMITLESRIKRAAPSVLFPTAFLAAVEHTVASSIASSTVVSAGAVAAGVSAWLPIAGAAIVGLVGAGAVWYYSGSNETASSTPQPVVAPVTQESHSVLAEPVLVEPAPSHSEPVRSTPQLAQPVASAPRFDDKANIESHNPVPALERARRRYEASSGLSRVSAGIALARIDASNASTILADVQTIADQQGLRQFQAETRAMRAAIIANDKQSARLLLREALQLGSAVVPQSKLSEWQLQLDVLSTE